MSFWVVAGVVVLAVVARAVWLMLWAPKDGADQSAGGPVIGPRIRGLGSYAFEVVGESHYAQSFVDILGSRAGTEDEVFGDAVLKLENRNPHDPNAVAVWVQGRQVGHLSRALAVDFRNRLRSSAVPQATEVAVGCRIYCGGAARMFSVSLDLPGRPD